MYPWKLVNPGSGLCARTASHLAEHPKYLNEKDHLLLFVISLVEAACDDRVILGHPVEKGSCGPRYPQNLRIRLEHEGDTAGADPPEAVSIIYPFGHCVFRPLGGWNPLRGSPGQREDHFPEHDTTKRGYCRDHHQSKPEAESGLDQVRENIPGQEQDQAMVKGTGDLRQYSAGQGDSAQRDGVGFLQERA